MTSKRSGEEPEGMAPAVKRHRSSPRAAKFSNAKRLRCKTLACVLENPANLGNLAAVMRNVDALGVGKLLVVDGFNLLQSKTWAQIRNNKHMNKISSSACKYAFMKTFKTTEECLEYLEEKKYVSLVTASAAKNIPNASLHDAYLTQKRLAVWFGNEAKGVSDEAIGKSAMCVQIPMAGVVESLNLAVSTGIVLATVVHKRRDFCTRKMIARER